MDKTAGVLKNDSKNKLRTESVESFFFVLVEPKGDVFYYNALRFGPRSTHNYTVTERLSRPTKKDTRDRAHLAHGVRSSA